MVSIPFFRRKRAWSILDLAFDRYDPTTHLPQVIRVGEQEVEPFISLRQVQDHLTLLAAFNKLSTGSSTRFPRVCEAAAFEYQRWAQTCLPRQQQRQNHLDNSSSSPNTSIPTPPLPPLDPTITIAESEDTQWQVPPPLGDDEVPPLGVLMCWHAHMLNPKVFDKECQGAYAALRGRKFPLAQVAAAIRTNTLPAQLDIPPNALSASMTTTIWDPLDIAAAVQRQAKFVGNMEGIGWLYGDMFGDDLDGGRENGESKGNGQKGGKVWEPLQRGIVRYHAWLDLVFATEGKYFLVPTLDIDLAWHTHQLLGKTYKRDTCTTLGLFLDHDDNAGEGRLDDGLKRAARLWKDRYGYAYLS